LLFQNGGTYIATIRGITQKKTQNEVEAMLRQLDEMDKQELELKLKREEEIKQKHLEIEKKKSIFDGIRKRKRKRFGLK